jgi:hypothetical protein
MSYPVGEPVMQQAREKLSDAQSELLSLIKTDKANEALALNARIAADNPSNKELEDWFIEKIERTWPAVVGQPRQAWVKARQPKSGYRRYSPRPETYEKLKEELLSPYKKTIAAEAKPAPEPEPEPEPTPEPQPKSEPEIAHGPWTEPPRPPENATPYQRLLYPPGLLGHVVQCIYDTSGLPDRTLALAGALTALGKSLDRKIVGPEGNSTILYNLILALTGAGKQHILDCVRLILEAMGLDNDIVAGGIASVQAIEEVLQGTNKSDDEPNGIPSPLVIIDEYGSFLSRITTKGQSGNVAEIPSTLQTLWGWQPRAVWKATIKASRTSVRRVYGPAFALLGSSTDRVFYGAVKSKYVGGGFINRHLIHNAGRGALKRVDPKYPIGKFPKWLIKKLKRIAGDPAPWDNRDLYFPDSAVKVRGMREIGWGEGAKKHWRNYEDEIRGIEDEEIREVWIRSPEIALRLATIVAAYCNSDTVEIPHLKWAIAYTDYSTSMLVKGLSKYMTEDLGMAEACDLLREEFMRHMIRVPKGREPGEMTIGEIRKYLEKKIEVNKIMGVVYQLQYCGDIKELNPAEGPGRPTKKYLWLKGVGKIR